MDQPRHYSPPLSDAEYATIDLALRHWRDLPERPTKAAYDGNTVTVQLLDTAAIDALIARLSLDFIPW